MNTNHPPATAGGSDKHSTHPLPQLVLTSLFLVITVSVACTASRSAGSQPLANSTPSVVQTPVQTSVSGQEKPTCQLTMAGAPAIKGLRLGMTPDEVLALFP